MNHVGEYVIKRSSQTFWMALVHIRDRCVIFAPADIRVLRQGLLVHTRCRIWLLWSTLACQHRRLEFFISESQQWAEREYGSRLVATIVFFRVFSPSKTTPWERTFGHRPWRRRRCSKHCPRGAIALGAQCCRRWIAFSCGRAGFYLITMRLMLWKHRYPFLEVSRGGSGLFWRRYISLRELAHVRARSQLNGTTNRWPHRNHVWLLKRTRCAVVQMVVKTNQNYRYSRKHTTVYRWPVQLIRTSLRLLPVAVKRLMLS